MNSSVYLSSVLIFTKKGKNGFYKRKHRPLFNNPVLFFIIKGGFYNEDNID